jgi:type I restriction enzyme, S subunit
LEALRALFRARCEKAVNQASLNQPDILELEVPLPPLTEQKRIAFLLARADRLRQLRRTAHDLGNALLQSVFLEMFGEPKINSKKWDVEVIGEFVKPTKQMNPQLLGRSDFWYVDITSIDRQSKTIVKPKSLKIEDAPSRARKHISANDILVSTVRPNLNAVAKVPKYLDNQIASTGFCILRPDTKKLNLEYLFSIVQSKYFVDHLVKNETGANYPAVSDGIILDTPIPIPPLSLQEEFAGVVARVESLRGRMGESTRQVEGLFESLLAEAFN